MTISRNGEKFDERLQKIVAKLKKNRKGTTRSLPNDFRYLRYWAEKVKAEDTHEFARIKKKYFDASISVGEKLYIDNLNYLKLSHSHKKGTKSRLIELLRFVYHYSNYTHDCFLEAGKKNQAKKNLKPFWDSYADEVFNKIDLLDYFQKSTLLRLVNQSKNVGIKINDKWVAVLEDKMRPQSQFNLSKVKNQLNEVEDYLAQEKTNTAIVLADESLELLMKDLCLKCGCDEETLSEKGKLFSRWGFSEYLTFLFKKGEVNETEKANFFEFHGWRNSVQHSGVEPSVRSVRSFIVEIKNFIENHYQ